MPSLCIKRKPRQRAVGNAQQISASYKRRGSYLNLSGPGHINQAPCLKPQTTDDGGPEHEQRDDIDDGHNADDDDDAEEDCGDNGSK